MMSYFTEHMDLLLQLNQNEKVLGQGIFVHH